MRQIMKSASTAIQILCVELLADYHVPHLLRAYLPVLGLRGGIRGECSRDVAGETAFRASSEARRNPNPRRCSKEMSTPIKRQHSLHASAWNRLQDGAWGDNRRYPRAALPDVLREHEGLRYQQGETNDSSIRLPSCDEDRNADYRQHSSR